MTDFDKRLQSQKKLQNKIIAQLQKYDAYKGTAMRQELKKTNIGALESLLKYEIIRGEEAN